MSEKTTIKRILVASDLSVHSACVVDRGALVATELGAELTVLHVVDSRFVQAAETIAKLRHAKGEPSGLRIARQRLDESIASLRVHRCAEVRGELVTGRPHQVIAEVARLKGADLIVIGAHSAETLVASMLGSICDRVLRTACAPVLIVRNRQLERYQKVLVATNYSDASRRALLVALQLASRAEITLLHVVDSHLERLVELLGATHAELDQYYADATAGASDRMDGDLEHVGSERERIAKLVIVGDPAVEIVKRSKASVANLTVLGRHRAEGPGVHLLGRITRTVLDAAHSDVLIASVG